MATLLIIGGTGFFGKSILDSYKRQLLTAWNIDKIFIMSRHPDEFKKNYPELISKEIEFIEADVSLVDSLPVTDFVIHAAASTDSSRYLLHNEKEKKNIIAGTLNYCRLAEKFHKNSKIVFCSSGAVYGYQDENNAFSKEESPLGDLSKLDNVKQSYAIAKRESEAAIQKLGDQNINVVIARCFSFIGKYIPRDQHFAIGNFIENGIQGKDIDVKADRVVYRSYMHSDDLVDWLFTLAVHSNPSCPIYNVGSDEVIEIRNLATIISKIYNVNIKSSEPDNSKIDRYIPSLEKVKKELNVKNKYSLKESILRTIE
jgi:nucleoside-diphosphate-sugar epimerase